MTAVAPMVGLKPLEKYVLLMLANYAGPDHTLFHSQATLAKDTALSPRAVRLYLAALEARGLIDRTPRYSRGSRSSDLIRLTFIPAPVAAMAPVIPADHAFHSGTKGRFIAAPRAEEPITEPVSNPSRARALAPRDRAAPSPEERKKVGEEMAQLAKSLGRKLG